MSIKNRKARKNYWKTIPKEIRKQKMSELAHKRHSNSSEIERSKLGKFLNSKRWNVENPQ